MRGDVTIDALLARPRNLETARALVDWVTELRARILRAEMAIGILSVEEAERAPQALRTAVECGLTNAWLDLAAWFAEPPGGQPDLLAAEGALRSAIAAGVPGARLRLVELFWFHLRENATPSQQREAHDIASSVAASDPGDAEAVHVLGLLTAHGFGTEASPGRAAQMQVDAAALGSARAMFEAHVHFATGAGVAEDPETALAYLDLAAAAAHPRAMYNMGARHATGQGVEKDLVKAVDWYQRASDAGNPRATAMLAVMYARGEGVARDEEQAKMLFDEAEYLGLDVSVLRASVGL